MAQETGTGVGRNRRPDIPLVEESSKDTAPILFRWQRALRDSGLVPSQRHVALAVSTYMDSDGGSAFPGVPRLTHDTGYSERTVRRNLARVVKAGWLTLEERGGLPGEKRRANRYRATFPDPGPYVTGDTGSGLPLTSKPLTPDTSDPPPLIEHPIEPSHRAEKFQNTDSSVDALKRRCVQIFAAKKVARDDCVRAIDELRATNIADELIDVALGQCENADARSLRYLDKIARDFFFQRTGTPA